MESQAARRHAALARQAGLAGDSYLFSSVPTHSRAFHGRTGEKVRLAQEPAASSSSIKANRSQGRDAKLGSGRSKPSHASPAAEGMSVLASRLRRSSRQGNEMTRIVVDVFVTARTEAKLQQAPPRSRCGALSARANHREQSTAPDNPSRASENPAAAESSEARRKKRMQ